MVLTKKESVIDAKKDLHENSVLNVAHILQELAADEMKFLFDLKKKTSLQITRMNSCKLQNEHKVS